MSNIKLINAIIERFEKHPVIPLPDKKINIMLDLEKSGVDLNALLTTDDATFYHDFFGIYCYMDRSKGELSLGFVPRVGLRN